MKQAALRFFAAIGLASLAISILAAISVEAAMGESATGSQPVTISLTLPTSIQLGQNVLLQAKLVDAKGAPIAKATVDFTSPATFLNATGDMVLAEVKTDGQGLAKANYEVRRNGQLTIKAQFAGDSTYAPATANGQTSVMGNQQLYVQSAGVKIPGLNASSTQEVGGWPRWTLSGWPIVLVLVIVWSLFGTAVFFMSRILHSDQKVQEEAP